MYILVSIFFVILSLSGSKCYEKLYYTSSKDTNESIITVSEERPSPDIGWVARGYFTNSINSTGFGFLEIETNPANSDEIQAYHAGYLEGKLTSELIYSHWYNVVDFFCKDPQRNNCSKLKDFVGNNSLWIEEQYDNNPYDPYWHHVHLIYIQIKGIFHGYRSNASFPKLELIDILLMNLFFELPDIQSIIGSNNLATESPASGEADHCSALIKLMPGNSDVYFGHNTWIDYNVMLRILKKYLLPYKKLSNIASSIPGIEISMSSYPGSVLSIDDFYLVPSSGLAVTETTNTVHNNSLFKEIQNEEIVWEGIRSMVANRLATSGKNWHKIFSRFNSGTCNNQWMVFDYKKFKPGEKLPKGALWVSEQMPGVIVKKDVTDVLNSQGYWSSYNVPYTDLIFRISGYAEKTQEPDGLWYNYTETARAKLFKRDHVTVTDMQSFMKLMRSNDFKDDPLAKCECSPSESGKGAIAAREDLNPPYGVKMNERKPRGAIDAKITNEKLFRKHGQFFAVSGPTAGTDNKLPLFRWSTSGFTQIRHLSHPDVFNFEPLLQQWSLPLRGKSQDSSKDD